MNAVIVALSIDFTLAQKVAHRLKKEVIIPELTIFSDGEVSYKFPPDLSLAGKKAIIIQSTCPPVSQKILKIGLVSHLLQNVGAQEIIGVIPYFGYARHEKSYIRGKPGPVEVVIKMLEAGNIKQFYCVELHDDQAEFYFSVPIYNIFLDDLIAQHIKEKIHPLKDCCIIAPDKGAAQRVKAVADILGVETLVYSKERYATDKTRVVGVEGTCTQKIAVMIDDMIDTGGTAINVAKKLKKQGFEKIFGYFIHPVLSDNAVERIEKSPFDKIFVSNSIPLHTQSNKIEVFDISKPICNELEKKILR